MDPLALALYAIICGALSVLAPNLGGFLPRLVAAAVGIVAAALLPVIKGVDRGLTRQTGRSRTWRIQLYDQTQ